MTICGVLFPSQPLGWPFCAAVATQSLENFCKADASSPIFKGKAGNKCAQDCTAAMAPS